MSTESYIVHQISDCIIKHTQHVFKIVVSILEQGHKSKYSKKTVKVLINMGIKISCLDDASSRPKYRQYEDQLEKRVGWKNQPIKYSKNVGKYTLTPYHDLVIGFVVVCKDEKMGSIQILFFFQNSNIKLSYCISYYLIHYMSYCYDLAYI